MYIVHCRREAVRHWANTTVFIRCGWM